MCSELETDPIREKKSTLKRKYFDLKHPRQHLSIKSYFFLEKQDF